MSVDQLPDAELGPMENGAAEAPDVTADVVADDGAEIAPALPLYRRVPWRKLVTVLAVAVIWLGIGLMCSPRDFRF